MDGIVCFLLGVAVLGCDPGAAAYQEAAQRIPPEHWRLVPAVRLWTGGGRSCYPGDESLNPAACAPLAPAGGIVLPRQRSDATLLHEVGHIVAAVDNWALQRAWQEALWPTGLPLPGARMPDYAAKLWQRGEHDRARREDFADVYRFQIEGALNDYPERAAWFAAELPVVVAH